MNGVSKQTNGTTNGTTATSVLKAAALREESGIAKIEVPDDNPFVLFRQWHADALASDLALPNALCLATATKDGHVSARHVILRRLDDDGFVIMTDRRSKKAAELEENPVASMVFLWCYKQADGTTINRQIRIEGGVQEVMSEHVGDLYEREPLYCKVRSHVCHQGQQVDWQDLKTSHDALLKKVAEDGAPLPCPGHVVVYKLIPTMIEYYYAYDFHIGDRMMFLKKPEGVWEHTRIAA